MPAKHTPHVPAQYYGYALQCTHFVALLLNAGTSHTISLEVLEDVAKHEEDDDIVAVQLKSALQTNPIADRSIELWKTFRNWIVSVSCGELVAAKARFEIHLGQKRRGPICELFSSVSTDETAAAAVAKAKARLCKKRKHNAPGNGDLEQLLGEVFSPQNEQRLRGIISRFSLTFGDGHAYAELLELMKQKFIDDDVAEDVLLHALGWVKSRLEILIENGKPSMVAVAEFRKEMMAFRNRLKSRQFLPSFAGTPSPEDIALHRLKVFVRQLHLVKMSDDQVLRAISDFLSAKVNRIEYAERGYVHDKSFDEYEDALKATWMNWRDEVELDKGSPEEKRGQLLALRCLREKLKLQGIVVPDDFTRGCFHSLADAPQIGWHPRYAELLNADDKE